MSKEFVYLTYKGVTVEMNSGEANKIALLKKANYKEGPKPEPRLKKASKPKKASVGKEKEGE